MKRFRAPWGPTLIIISVSGTVLLLILASQGLMRFRTGSLPGMFLGVCPLLLLFSCALFAILGYTIEPDAILVHRLLWSTRLPRGGLKAATVAPRLLGWSIRTFGNGGLFSFSGLYYNRHLGSYRAYVTDLRSTVVLHYIDRTIVVSPGKPELFVQELGMRTAG